MAYRYENEKDYRLRRHTELPAVPRSPECPRPRAAHGTRRPQVSSVTALPQLQPTKAAGYRSRAKKPASSEVPSLPPVDAGPNILVVETPRTPSPLRDAINRAMAEEEDLSPRTEIHLRLEGFNNMNTQALYEQKLLRELRKGYRPKTLHERVTAARLQFFFTPDIDQQTAEGLPAESEESREEKEQRDADHWKQVIAKREAKREEARRRREENLASLHEFTEPPTLSTSVTVDTVFKRAREQRRDNGEGIPVCASEGFHPPGDITLRTSDEEEEETRNLFAMITTTAHDEWRDGLHLDPEYNTDTTRDGEFGEKGSDLLPPETNQNTKPVDDTDYFYDKRGIGYTPPCSLSPESERSDLSPRTDDGDLSPRSHEDLSPRDDLSLRTEEDLSLEDLENRSPESEESELSPEALEDAQVLFRATQDADQAVELAMAELKKSRECFPLTPRDPGTSTFLTQTLTQDLTQTLTQAELPTDEDFFDRDLNRDKSPGEWSEGEVTSGLGLTSDLDLSAKDPQLSRDFHCASTTTFIVSSNHRSITRNQLAEEGVVPFWSASATSLNQGELTTDGDPRPASSLLTDYQPAIQSDFGEERPKLGIHYVDHPPMARRAKSTRRLQSDWCPSGGHLSDQSTPSGGHLSDQSAPGPSHARTFLYAGKTYTVCGADDVESSSSPSSDDTILWSQTPEAERNPPPLNMDHYNDLTRVPGRAYLKKEGATSRFLNEEETRTLEDDISHCVSPDRHSPVSPAFKFTGTTPLPTVANIIAAPEPKPEPLEAWPAPSSPEESAPPSPNDPTRLTLEDYMSETECAALRTMINSPTPARRARSRNPLRYRRTKVGPAPEPAQRPRPVPSTAQDPDPPSLGRWTRFKNMFFAWLCIDADAVQVFDARTEEKALARELERQEKKVREREKKEREQAEKKAKEIEKKAQKAAALEEKERKRAEQLAKKEQEKAEQVRRKEEKKAAQLAKKAEKSRRRGR